MYQFESLNGQYAIEVTTTLPTGQESIYSALLALSAGYQSKDHSFIFEMTSRTHVQLNHRAPEQSVDQIMVRLSGAHYPIRFKVSIGGEVESLLNFGQISKRWEDECTQVLKEFPCVAVEKYIDRARPAMENEKSYLEALQRDSFVQFYFARQEQGEERRFICHNFPRRGESTMYLLPRKETPTPSGTITFSTPPEEENERKNGTVTYTYAPQSMDILSIEAAFVSGTPQARSLKKISITADSKKREIVNPHKLFSLLMNKK